MLTNLTNRSFKDYPTEPQCAGVREALKCATETTIVVCMQYDADIVAFEACDEPIVSRYTNPNNCKRITTEEGRALFVCDIEELQKIASGLDEAGEYTLACTLRPEKQELTTGALNKREG